MKQRRSTKVPRDQIERARDSAMLQALFYWRLAELQPPGARRGLDRGVFHAAGEHAAKAALRLARSLTGGRIPQ